MTVLQHQSDAMAPTTHAQPCMMDQRFSWREQASDAAQDHQNRAERQVAQWRAESTMLLHPKLKFVALLEEARRHEIATILSGGGSRPHCDTSSPQLLVSDVNKAYSNLITEARKLFDERQQRGMSEESLRDLAAQATSSFAALYPWSDGVTCRDIPPTHPAHAALARRNGVATGSSGVTVLTSFSAALSCSQLKLQASLACKEQRLEEYAATRRRPLAPHPVCCSPQQP